MWINKIADTKKNRIDLEYHILFDKGKSIMKADVCMKSYDETQPLYLKTYRSEVRLGAVPTINQKWYKLPKRESNRQQNPQTHWFCKNLSGCQAQKRYINIERAGTKYTTWTWEGPIITALPESWVWILLGVHQPPSSQNHFKKDMDRICYHREYNEFYSDIATW